MYKAIMGFFQQILDAALPDTCVVCQQAVQTSARHRSCPHCWAALPRIINACRHCALPLQRDDICGQCQQNPLCENSCIAALLYQGVGRELVHKLKYSHGLREGHTLANAMLEAISLRYSNQPLPQAIIPVPLTYWRQVRRGFNQAAWLSHLLSRALDLPVLIRHIHRRPGTAQHKKNRAARLQLPDNSFCISKPIPWQHVAVVDDVLTTGATVTGLTNHLRRAGACKVDIWCATRTTVFNHNPP